MKVLKLGGTSLGSAQRIINASQLVDENSPSLLVLSAMSGITNKLTEVYADALSRKIKNAFIKLDEIETHFKETAYLLFEQNDWLKHSLSEIETTIDEIKNTISEIPFASLLSYGEVITSRLFSNYLSSISHENVLLDALAFMTLDKDGEPDLSAIASNLEDQLAKHPKNQTFITQGFICTDFNGNVSNLKRGGSDYTATLIGAALTAENITIWTDIDGLHNNDPRFVENTYSITKLNFDEAAELAYFGAKVLHPSSIRPAREKNIPVLLKNTMNPSAKGTLITSDKSIEGIKAIAAKDGIQLIRVQSGRMLMAHGFLKNLFRVFDKYKVPVDVITTSEVAVSVTIEKSNMIDAIIHDLEKFGSVEVIDDCSIISAVGSDISLNPKVLEPLFKCLSQIQPRMISLGGSRNNITIVLDSNKKAEALNLLNQSIFNTTPYDNVATE